MSYDKTEHEIELNGLLEEILNEDANADIKSMRASLKSLDLVIRKAEIKDRKVKDAVIDIDNALRAIEKGLK